MLSKWHLSDLSKFYMKKGRVFIYGHCCTSGIFSIFFFAFKKLLDKKDGSVKKNSIPFDKAFSLTFKHFHKVPLKLAFDLHISIFRLYSYRPF